VRDCKKPNGNCTVAKDPDDGLVVQCVGPWVKDKHHYLGKYLAATSQVRARYLPPHGDGGTTYVELFAGNGRAYIPDTKEFIDGSPLIAVNDPHRSFSDIILCDIDEENVHALRERTKHTRRVRVEQGDCNAIIDRIVRSIPKRSYAVALLDPFGPGALSFETIRRLAAFPRMDLILHFPLGAMKRNFKDYAKYERFLGLPAKDWGVDIIHGEDISSLIPVMRRQLISLGYGEHGVDVRSPRVTNTSNVLLYHLVFASKHIRGDEIWNSVTKNPPNGQIAMPW
jgi:three-Cys-motif partner protein